MKKISLGIFISLLFCSRFFSQEKIFSISIEPFFAVRHGYLSEYVYSNSSVDGSQYYLSLLDWNIACNPYLGISADAKIWKFRVNTDCKFLIPGETGTLCDSDWKQDADYKTGNTSLKTNYSEHDNYLSDGMNFSAKLLFDFFPAPRFSISPSLGVGFEYYSMIGKNGIAWYGNPKDTGKGYFYSYNDLNFYGYNDLNNRKLVYFNGDVIKLERNDYYAWLGFDIRYATKNQKFKFGLCAEISPYTYILSVDTHLKRNTIFIDIAKGYFSSYRGNIFAQYNFSTLLGLKINFDWLYTRELKGYTYIKEGNSNFVKGGESGASTRYFDFRISVLLNF